MAQPTKIPRAFASSGDKNTIPDSTGSIGLASWSEGFPAITSTPFAQGGVAPKRADFNGIFNAISAGLLWLQQGGVYDYDNSTDYEVGNLAVVSGIIYICKTANGPGSSLHSPSTDTSETYWGRIYPQYGTFNRMYFSQTSGSYTAPATGVYRITIKGGGGGGGPLGSTTTRSNGTGGGEGAQLMFYETLTKNQSYAYVIGAGGAAGVNATADDAAAGANAGGDTSFTVSSGVTYTAGGGTAGAPSSNLTKSAGGSGGYTIPTGKTAFITYGHHGQNGGYIGNIVDASIPRFGGYLYGGGGSNTAVGKMGAGGAGASSYNYSEPTAGGPGFILIEYAG